MYPVSEDYISAMRCPVQRHRLTGTVGEVAFADEDILSGSFSITGQCSENGNVQIGQVYIGELKMTFLSKDKLSRYSLKGAEITPHFGLRLSSGSYEYIPLGVFTVQEASWGVSGVAITAYDHLAKLDRSFSGSKLHGTPFTLLTLACTNCGIELGMLRDEFEDFPNGTAVLQIYEDNDCETWRDIVSWIAQTLGANVFADREGKIVLRKYGREVVDTVDDYHRLSGATFGDYETCYTGLSCVNIEEQTTSYYGEEEDTGLTYNLGMNPFLQYAVSGTVDEMRRSILTSLGEILYVPFRVDVIGNPAYDLMDVIRFTDGIADGEKISCITKYQFRYGDRFSFQGDGQNPALASQNSKSDKKIAGLMSQIESITSSINHLIYDYNTGPLEVSQYEMTVGMITFYISEQADVEGHFLMRYEASNPTRITLRFYDTQVEELYSPLIMEVQEGKGVIGIPHAYLHREVGIHAVYVTVQCTIGDLFIPTRGVFYSIDAGNFATAIDEIPMDIRDITMRQLLESNGPDEIWTIGLEKGEAYVSKRPYSTSPNARAGWEGVIALGKAVDAAIEFDGEWVCRTDAEQYTLQTEDQPWYFYITEEGELYARHGEDEESITLLDTDVTHVSVCRGYSSMLYPDQDQGLVCAYIKDHEVCYRTYVYDPLLDTKKWLSAVCLDDSESWDSVHVTRLNDYRLSFTLSNDERNLWLITERTYVGQSAYPELATFFTRPGWLGVSVVTEDIVYDGEARAFEIEGEPQTDFIVDFPHDVKLWKNYHSGDPIVAVNGETLAENRYTVTTDDKVLLLKLKTAVGPQRNANSVITLTMPGFTHYVEGNGIRYMFDEDLTYSWMIIRPIRIVNGYEIENIRLTNDPDITILISPIVDVKARAVKEERTLSFGTAALVVVKEVKAVNTTAPEESMTFSIATESTITVTLAGTSPI